MNGIFSTLTALSLAQLLGKHGPLATHVALDVTEKFLQQLAGRSLDTECLLAICPDTIEVTLQLQSMSVQRVSYRPELRQPIARPYLAWPEYGAWVASRAPAPVGGMAAAVYCVGIVLYHMLADHPPFVGSDLVDLAMRHLTEPLPLLPKAIRQTQLADLVAQCLAKEPSERFETLATLQDALGLARPAARTRVEALSLVSTRTGKAIALHTVGVDHPDGAREVLVGRNDYLLHHRVDLDLRSEPNGTSVHRRQAILRRSIADLWSIEDWRDPAHPRGAAGLDTSVNGSKLQPGERRSLEPGDRIDFGPVRMLLQG